MSETIKYRVKNYTLEIVPVKVIRETNNFLIVPGYNGREERTAKQSNYEKYFDSYLEAVNYHVNRIESTIKGLQESIDRETRQLVKAKILLECEPPKLAEGRQP